MADRSVEKIDNSHNAMSWKFNNPPERDQWMRTFPKPLPSTHRLEYAWNDDNTVLTLRPVPVTGGQPAEAPQADPHAEARGAVLNELDGANRADLETRAAKAGVKVQKQMTDAQVKAAIADKLAPTK